jgi:hypothetical protein
MWFNSLCFILSSKDIHCKFSSLLSFLT